jgi:hypothetical protein
MITLYKFNNQAIEEKKKIPISENSRSPLQKNTLWEELRGELN